MATENPMMAGVAGRYASALFDLAKEQGKLKDVEADIVSVQKMIDESGDLRRLVLSPVFSAEEQIKGLGAVLGKAGVSPLTQNFLKLAARNRRLFAVSDMAKAFISLLARERGEVTAEVSSAHPLTDVQLQSLKDTLQSSAGRNVRLLTRVDSSLLGGLIVKIGSRMIDSSLRTKLNSLKVAMKGTG